MAGEVFNYEEHVAYFRSQVAPRLDATRRFIGSVGFARKRRLLSAARCVLIPSTAPETSSLVAMEAAACGTPVIAFRVGALAETVEDRVSGLLVSDVEEMADAIPLACAISREQCRRVARERFDVGRMTAAYLERYRQLAGVVAV
jgi:glycosyltransferase involved in cell wall biosynthesis